MTDVEPVLRSTLQFSTSVEVRLGIVRWSVGWSVGWSVMLSSKSLKNGLLQILNDLDSAGRGKKREEEGGMRGKRDEESEKMKMLLKK